VDEGSPETTDAQWAAIASAAVEIVPPHSSVAVNAGPAALHLANHLVDVEGLTIITNSLTVANIVDRSLAIRGREWVDLILTGGLRSSSGALVGPTALAALTRINPALLLLSVDGADENAGLTTSDVLEAEINRAFLARAGQSAVIVSAAQWGTVGMNFLAPFDGSGFLVTDAQLDNGAAAKIGACGVSVRRVGANLVL
jgi:DeoR/GlpR family transcriptional regulator of sugar metabolism